MSFHTSEEKDHDKVLHKSKIIFNYAHGQCGICAESLFRCQLSWGMIQLWWSVAEGGIVVERVLVQQVAIPSCTISCSIIVLWITSIAGDNSQAAERSGWYRTPAPLWETIWIISCLPADCLWGLEDSDVWAEACMSGVGSVRAMTQFVFPGRAGTTQSPSSVSHSSHKVELFYTLFSNLWMFNLWLLLWIVLSLMHIIYL